MSQQSFIQLKRTPEIESIMKARQSAFCLLTLIAYRINRDNKYSDRKIGEAYIGDWSSYGASSEQVYRTDKKWLETNGLITTKVTNKGTIAKLTNADIFELNIDLTNGQETDKLTDNKRTTNGQLTTNNKEINKKRKEIINSLFFEFWNLYPRKINKKKAQEKYNVILKGSKNIKDTHKSILNGLKNALVSWRDTEPQFIPYPITWLNGERWNDTIEKKELKRLNIEDIPEDYREKFKHYLSFDRKKAKQLLKDLNLDHFIF